MSNNRQENGRCKAGDGIAGLRFPAITSPALQGHCIGLQVIDHNQVRTDTSVPVSSIPNSVWMAVSEFIDPKLPHHNSDDPAGSSYVFPLMAICLTATDAAVH